MRIKDDTRCSDFGWWFLRPSSHVYFIRPFKHCQVLIIVIHKVLLRFSRRPRIACIICHTWMVSNVRTKKVYHLLIFGDLMVTCFQRDLTVYQLLWLVFLLPSCLRFLSSLARFEYFVKFSVIRGNDEVHYLKSFFSLLSITISDLPAWVGSLVLCQNPRELCAFHFPGQIFACAHTICLYNQRFCYLHNSQWIIFCSQLLYYFGPVCCIH